MVNRFKQPSTWRGIMMLAMAFGLQISPELQEAIISVGVAAVGAVGAFTND